ncbi:MAG: DUF1653 domain-containing protein [Patescibacteria group bacterium]
MKIPTNIPVKGAFYYHYKHNPNGSMNNYVYQVVGVGYHTEEDDVHFVVYQPIYESSVYKAGKFFDIRPLEMWMGNVEIDGESVSRFTLITDEKVIEGLTRIRDEMYK